MMLETRPKWQEEFLGIYGEHPSKSLTLDLKPFLYSVASGHGVGKRYIDWNAHKLGTFYQRI